jgi:hypothetical protein
MKFAEDLQGGAIHAIDVRCAQANDVAEALLRQRHDEGIFRSASNGLKAGLLDQVESFRIGDKKSEREDDLLDTFCYGIVLALGDNEGF